MANTPQEWSEFSPEDMERLRKRLNVGRASLAHWRATHGGATRDEVLLEQQEISHGEEIFYTHLVDGLDLDEVKTNPTAPLVVGRVNTLVGEAGIAAGGAIEDWVGTAGTAAAQAQEIIRFCLAAQQRTGGIHGIERRQEAVENRVRALLSSRVRATPQEVQDLQRDISRLETVLSAAPPRLRRDKSFRDAEEAARRAREVWRRQQADVARGFAERYGESVVGDGKKALEVAEEYALPVGAGAVGGVVGAIASPTSFGALMTEAGLTGYTWSLVGGGLSVAAGVGAYALCRNFNVSKKVSVAAGIGTAIATGVASTAVPIALLTVSIGGIVYMGWKAVQVWGKSGRK